MVSRRRSFRFAPAEGRGRRYKKKKGELFISPPSPVHLCTRLLDERQTLDDRVGVVPEANAVNAVR